MNNPFDKRQRKSLVSDILPPVSKYLEDIQDTIMISICENRAREICISKINTRNISILEIYLITDTHSYVETLDVLYDINPDEILINDSCKGNILTKKITETFNSLNHRIIYISRQYFDQDRGAEMLNRVLVGNDDADLLAKYIVLAGTFCLLRYLENTIEQYGIANYSMRLIFMNSSTNSRMIIDRRSALNLELVTNSKTGNQKGTLFSILNHTSTSIGNRLLRQNILKPPIDFVTINTRLETVEILLKLLDYTEQIREILQSLPDLDKMLNGLSVAPKSTTQRTVRNSIDTILYLKHAIKSAKVLENIIQDMITKHQPMNQLLVTLKESLRVNNLIVIERMLNDIISDASTFTKSSQDMKYQECFAIRAGKSGELDLYRKSYLQTVEDIHKVASIISKDIGFPVKVLYTNARGYHLGFSITSIGNISAVPNIFIQVVQNAKSISCTTDTVLSLSDRANEAMSNALVLTQDLLQDTLSNIRRHLDTLFVVVDSIALLDMLISFTYHIQLSKVAHTKPQFTQDNILQIVEGQHPILCQDLKYKYHPNSCSLDNNKRINIITGPNGSGKTIFLKQTVLIVIMAQIGSFIPAKYAKLSIRDRILTRIGTSDDMEHNLSTFSTEMKETAYIINNLSANSIILIDELGRGTSNIDGVSLAYAVTEYIANFDALALFVTHYPQITTLSSYYSCIQNIHLKTTINVNQESNTDKKVELNYLHEICEGASEMRNGYGIMIAETCGFPNEVIQEARRIQKLLRVHLPLVNPIMTNSYESAMDLFNKIKSIHERNSKENFTNTKIMRNDLTTLLQTITTQESESILYYLKDTTRGKTEVRHNIIEEINEIDEIQPDEFILTPDQLIHSTKTKTHKASSLVSEAGSVEDTIVDYESEQETIEDSYDIADFLSDLISSKKAKFSNNVVEEDENKTFPTIR